VLTVPWQILGGDVGQHHLEPIYDGTQGNSIHTFHQRLQVSVTDTSFKSLLMLFLEDYKVLRPCIPLCIQEGCQGLLLEAGWWVPRAVAPGGPNWPGSAEGTESSVSWGLTS
jgi:hypothetical protein